MWGRGVKMLEGGAEGLEGVVHVPEGGVDVL